MVEGAHFPAGLRVLAVDDDRACLTVLENLLRKCQYHVTTTTQAVQALEMLRKNRNKFDLVISDVNMPEMDGFKLLQHVEHETDLPFIMLSGYGDKERVMKGVEYGACDFLTKPVRIQELQNIWQHVVRRKIDSKDKNKTENDQINCSLAGKFATEEKGCTIAGECSKALATKTNANQNIKVDQKRKERCEAEEGEEDDKENDEPSNQKKPRLVWDAELHSKFLSAIDQLGIDKAFPKKILDLMNIEGLSRENVASHLQKFRLGLKKPNQRASMVPTLLGTSDPYHRMGSLDCFRTSSGPGTMLSNTVPSYRYGPGGLYATGMNSSPLVQAAQSRNINSSSIKTHGNMHTSIFSGNQSSSLLQGIPTPIEANQFQQNNSIACFRRLNLLDDSIGFKDSSSFWGNRVTVRNAANNSLPSLSNNHLHFQAISTLAHHSEAFRNHSSFGAAAVNTQSFDPNSCGSSKMMDDYNNKSWQGAAQISNFPSNTSAVGKVFNNDQLLQHNLKFSSSTFSSRNSPVGFSSAVPSEDDVLGEVLREEGLLGNVLLASSYKGGYSKHTSQTFNSMNAVISPNGGTSSLGNSFDQNNAVDNKRIDASLVGQMNGVNPSITQCGEGENFYSMKSNDAYVLQSMKSGEGLVQNTFDSLDDIMNEIDKQADVFQNFHYEQICSDSSVSSNGINE
ncbi:unnamed protein product [Sphenostylis stenocarpa]|uniref:Two-component response regulator n=1 Tax=Sphenostylis stenocarpa TaxID=92480 RepID=A0AA86SMZ1_9FABA|nr:unnamed protein product [Sphenostylis stenocarpa]